MSKTETKTGGATGQLQSDLQNSDVPEFLTWDKRVRTRNMQHGLLTQKDVETHLAALPDLVGQCDPMGLGQPALSIDADVDLDDDDEDDDDASES